MKNIIAHKTKYVFADTPEKAERYRTFLKEHILELSPKYYGVTDIQRVLTPDGIMYAVRLVPELDNPSYEVIAECWVNNVHIYLWRDKCWMIAVDKHRNLIVASKLSQHVRSDDDLFKAVTTLDHERIKTMVVFEVGETCEVIPQ